MNPITKLRLRLFGIPAIDSKASNMENPLAEHIAKFTGRHTKFKKRKFLRHSRKAAKCKPDINKQHANA